MGRNKRAEKREKGQEQAGRKTRKRARTGGQKNEKKGKNRRAGGAEAFPQIRRGLSAEGRLSPSPISYHATQQPTTHAHGEFVPSGKRADAPPPPPPPCAFMALITCRHAFQATTAVAKTFAGLVAHGGLGGTRWSSCFSGRALRSMHLAPARFGRRPAGVPESQHDLYLEHADLAHDQPSVRPFEAPVVLEAPVKLLYELLQKKGFIDAKRRPLPIDQVAGQDDHRIVAWYRSIAIGLLKYHSFCDNLRKVRSIANYLLRWSAIYTLAKKHKSSSSQIITKHTKSLVISKDVKTLAAYLTPMEISQYKKRFIVDLDPTPPEALIDMLFARLVQKRLLGERCAVKGCRQRHVEMHHIRQIEKAGGTHKVRSAREAQILEGIKALQGTLNKKHIPLCVRHHDDLHMGKLFIDDLDMNVVI